MKLFHTMASVFFAGPSPKSATWRRTRLQMLRHAVSCCEITCDLVASNKHNLRRIYSGQSAKQLNWKAAEQRGELRRRLSAAEVARDQAGRPKGQEHRKLKRPNKSNVKNPRTGLATKAFQKVESQNSQWEKVTCRERPCAAQHMCALGSLDEFLCSNWTNWLT